MTIDTSGGGLRKRRRRYTNMPSDTISDPDISFKALGILLFSLDKPDGWVFRADAIARERNKDGRDSVASGYKELAQRGYYRVERRRMLDGTFKMGNAISEEPVEEWVREYEEYGGKPIPLQQQPDGTFKVQRKDGSLTSDGFDGAYAQVGPVTGFPEPGDPDPDDPGSGGAEFGDPGAITNRENPLPKPNPSGGAPLRSAPPSGGRASTRGAPPEPSGQSSDDGTPALFDVSEEPPTGNDLARTSGGSGPAKGGRKKRTPTLFREDWQPSPEAIAKAREQFPMFDDARLKREVQKRIIHSRLHNQRFSNHDLAWLKWLHKALDIDLRDQQGGGSARPGQSGGPGMYRDEEERDVSSWENFNTRPVPVPDQPPTKAELDAQLEKSGEELGRRVQEDRLARLRARREAQRSWKQNIG